MAFMQSRFEGNHNKPEVLLSFDPEKMKEKNFLNDTIDVFHLRTKVGNPSAKMLDGAFKVHTSWEGCSPATIQVITQVSVTDNIWRAPIRITSFPHYVAIIYFLIESWQKRDMQTTDFLVGKFTIQMRPNDLYCCPIKKDEQDINLHDRRLSYATLKTSTCFKKMFWDSLVLHEWEPWQSRSLYPDSSRRHCTMCSFVLWSDQVSWHVFHNILLMQHLKSWEEFHDNHPMLTGGSWKGGSSKPDQVIVPEKVKQREEKNLFSCVKNIMRRQEKRGTLFHSAPENEEARNWCQLCFISLSVKSLCHFFLHRKLLKKIHHCAHTYEKYNHMLEWLEARCSDTHLQQVFWEAHQRPHLLCAACLTGPTTICIPQKPFHRRRYCLHPAHCSLPPGK